MLHDQSNDIRKTVETYERALAHTSLPDIPFHSEPLLNGHKGYETLSLTQRKKLLSSFGAMVRYLPIQYKTFIYRRSEYEEPQRLPSRMKHDISNLLFDNLPFFQSFDDVKVYYDNGQDIVSRALHESIGFVLSKSAIVARKTHMADYRLAQVADYLCTIELAAIKYAAKEDGGTYDKFFGTVSSFKKNWLKQARRKLIK